MEELFRTKTEVRLKSKETLVAYGRFDDNVYVMKSGIIRYCYFDGIRERTFGFAMPGSVMIQYHCHFMRKPSFFQPEACGETVVMKIARRDFDALIARSHEFSNWMLTLSSGQLYTNEAKLSLINGMAKERFVALIRNRPEIMACVPQKVIASYLGITPTYLSRLRKEFFRKKQTGRD